MRKQKKEKDAIDKMIEHLAHSNLNKACAKLSPQSEKLENQLARLNPYLPQDTINMIVDYTILLDGFYSKSIPSERLHREQIQHLIAATFSVAFAISQGPDIAKVLPIMALAGTHTHLAKKIMEAYLKNLKQNTAH